MNLAFPGPRRGPGSSDGWSNDGRRGILVTGATGYVGGRLVAALESAGVPLRCLARRPEALAGRVAASTEVVKGDCLDPATLPAALAGVRHGLLPRALHGRRPRLRGAGRDGRPKLRGGGARGGRAAHRLPRRPGRGGHASSPSTSAAGSRPATCSGPAGSRSWSCARPSSSGPAASPTKWCARSWSAFR